MLLLSIRRMLDTSLVWCMTSFYSDFSIWYLCLIMITWSSIRVMLATFYFPSSNWAMLVFLIYCWIEKLRIIKFKFNHIIKMLGQAFCWHVFMHLRVLFISLLFLLNLILLALHFIDQLWHILLIFVISN